MRVLTKNIVQLIELKALSDCEDSWATRSGNTKQTYVRDPVTCQRSKLSNETNMFPDIYCCCCHVTQYGRFECSETDFLTLQVAAVSLIG